MARNKNRWIGTAIILVLLSSCQKETENNEFDTSNKEVFNSEMTIENNAQVIEIKDDVTPNRRAPAAPEPPGDLEDVPEVTAGQALQLSCIQNPNHCDDDLMTGNTPVPNSIDRGKRLGIADRQHLDAGTNRIHSYKLPTRTVTGFVAKERTYYLKLPNNVANANYRVQLSPKYNNRDVDIFVYKLSVVNGKLVRTLKAWGINRPGLTETLHLSESGYYELVVDSQSPTLGNDYILSVTKNTAIKTTTRIVNNKVQYQFATTPNLGLETLIGWRIQRAGSTIAQTFTPVQLYFIFPCSNTCHYQITPVYRNRHTNQVVEHLEMTTTIRP
jgi:hypothetical protein